MNDSVFKSAQSRFGIDLLDVGTLSHVIIDLKYSSQDNFMKENLYQGFPKAYLHKEAFEKFKKATLLLQEQYPGHKFIVYDALRPQKIQKKMADFVCGTPYEHYVAKPEPGSMHNFGLAIDLSLVDSNGKILDMGTDFDDFTEAAQPQLEEKLLTEGSLTLPQVQNRRILRQIMLAAGFLQLPHEWWHYNALAPKEVWGKFEIVT